MKLSKKRTCNGCKALRVSIGFGSDSCDLNYELNVTAGVHCTKEITPVSACYKPLTNNNLMKALDLKKQDPDHWRKPSS